MYRNNPNCVSLKNFVISGSVIKLLFSKYQWSMDERWFEYMREKTLIALLSLIYSGDKWNCLYSKQITTPLTSRNENKHNNEHP